METQELVLINGRERIRIHAVTSDTHFGHRNIANLANRPFDNTNGTFEMDSTLLANWNNMVAKDETVLHLGDVALGKCEESLKWIKAANGRVALVPGNHDEISSAGKRTKARQARMRQFYEDAFEWILPETGVFLEAIRGNQTRMLQASHYPSFGNSHKMSEDGQPDVPDRYAKFRPEISIAPIIHGHTHSHSVFDEDYPEEFHVGVEAHDLTPVRANVILDWVFSR